MNASKPGAQFVQEKNGVTRMPLGGPAISVRPDRELLFHDERTCSFAMRCRI